MYPLSPPDRAELRRKSEAQMHRVRLDHELKQASDALTRAIGHAVPGEGTTTKILLLREQVFDLISDRD